MQKKKREKNSPTKSSLIKNQTNTSRNWKWDLRWMDGVEQAKEMHFFYITSTLPLLVCQ
jgi:hypothetical protein